MLKEKLMMTAIEKATAAIFAGAMLALEVCEKEREMKERRARRNKEAY